MPLLTLYEFGEYCPLPLNATELAKFKVYLNEVWQSRNLYWLDYEEDSLYYEPFFNWRAGAIQARNYVGCLKFEDLTIQIFPKLFANQELSHPKLILKHLLFYLSYSQSRHFPLDWGEWDMLEGEGFLSIWLWIWLNFIEKTCQTQAFGQYERIEEASSTFRGSLDLPNYLKNGLSSGNWQELALQSEPFLLDNQINQLLKFVLKNVSQLTDNQLISEKTMAVLFLLRAIQDRHFSYQTCQNLYLPSLANDYQKILDFCKIILLNGETNLPDPQFHNFSFLLPSEKLFEEFIFQFIHQHLAEWQAEAQSTTFLAQNTEMASSAFQIRNDIYLPKQNIVLDTKYKLRSQPIKPENNFGIESRDMYQMLSYGIARQAQKVILLYPSRFNEPQLSKHEFMVKGGLLGFNQLIIKALDLDITLGETDNWQKKIIEKIKNQLINALI
jgi:5-methylcytosine-specific restriction enzyme subunit McrC